MAEAEVPGRDATRGRCWFSSDEKKLFFDLRKTAIRKSMVYPVEFFARVSVFNLDSLMCHWENLKFTVLGAFAKCWTPVSSAHGSLCSRLKSLVFTVLDVFV